MNEVDIFKALGDQTRLKILECVKNGEKCICEIIPYTKKSQPNVSQHLKVLKNAGLIYEKKNGTNILIQPANKDVFKIMDMVKEMK